MTDSAETNSKPLCVDLDGTLVKSDTLVDAILVLTRTHPHLLLQLPGALMRGKAAFKAFIASHVELDVTQLPYNRQVLHFLQEEHARGRKIYLATGADIRVVERIASHLGIFSGVLGSDGTTNLTGQKKLASLHNHFGQGGYAYIGNSTVDLALLSDASEKMLANPSTVLKRSLRKRGIAPSHIFEERANVFRSLVKAFRPHQWAKNLLILLPPLLAHHRALSVYVQASLAFFCFCAIASSTYLVNDLLDIEADRRNVGKRTRPFASGDLSPAIGLIASATLLIFGLAVAVALPSDFFLWLLLYIASTFAYSLYIKRIAILDVLVLSGLYTVRILAGGAATNTPISHWLAGFAIFLFFSLAIVKRFAELEQIRLAGKQLKNGRGYLMTDVDQMRAFGTASAFAAVVVFSNYISSQDVVKLYGHPRYLWLFVPFMILWTCRVWLLASRGELNEDPVAFALTDIPSLLMGVCVLVIVLLAI
ncbi:MAG: UbiA family prenyltransferase [Acidobacteria bacterium]|nr:UbiA family prenyltransferase [Acidobacteriota bacterium]